MPRLTRAALEVAVAEARARAPEEACGLLVGREGPEGRTVVRAVPVENALGAGAPSRYLIPATALRAAEAEAARDGLTVVGAYHGHPDGTAEPSATDREHAWPWYTYLIVPVAGGKAGEPRAWRLLEDRGGFEEEELVITEDE